MFKIGCVQKKEEREEEEKKITHTGRFAGYWKECKASRREEQPGREEKELAGSEG